ncbi:arsenate reductase family protein [Erysipelothrix aquatica]|uniref:arsenate reductase family protein n=1 Tax=Erysipelothrix aquatica TaxID=2683714 RepID=UPI00135A41A2|nr:arsenate reductase family protein [Erysipelothrix aquatica]
MKTQFICYKKCSTCKKAEKLLRKLNIDFDPREIMDDNPTSEELHSWIKISGLPLKSFFNTSGIMYRELNLKDKLPTLTDDEAIDLLATSGRLVKRPILIHANKVLVGFKESDYLELFEK